MPGWAFVARETVEVLLFLGLQAFIWFPWWMIVSTGSPRLRISDRFVQSMVFFFAQIIALSLVLGIMGWLSGGLLLASNMCFSGLLLIYRVRRGQGVWSFRCPSVAHSFGTGGMKVLNE